MKRIKVFLTMCLIALLLPVLPAAAEAAQDLGITVTASTDTVTVGEEFTVTVSLRGYTDEDLMVGLQADIQLPKQLEVVDHKTKILDETAAFNATSLQTEAGTARLLYVPEGDAGLPLMTEELYTVTFRLGEGITGRGSIELPLTAKLRTESMDESRQVNPTITISYSVAASVTKGDSTEYFASLTDALTKAEKDDIVTLLAQPEDDEQIAQVVTIRPNGFTIPCAKEWAAVDNKDGTYRVDQIDFGHYGQNLRLQDLLRVGFYFTVNTKLPVENVGALLWTAEQYATETDFTVTSTNAKNYLNPLKDGDVYIIESDGIYAQNLDDKLYMIPYAKINGSYAYGDVKEYSPLIYCAKVCNSQDSNLADAKTLVIDLLNYATAARKYFCITEKLPEPAADFNSILSEADRAVNWNEGLMRSHPETKETGSFATKLYGRNVNLLEAVSIGIYYANAADIAGGYFWNEADYAAYTEHTAENATDVTVDEPMAGGYRKLNVKNLYAYNLYDNYYVRPYNASGELGDTIGTSVASYLSRVIESYSSSTKPDELAAVDVAKAMQVYGNNARTNSALNRG